MTNPFDQFRPTVNGAPALHGRPSTPVAGSPAFPGTPLTPLEFRDPATAYPHNPAYVTPETARMPRAGTLGPITDIAEIPSLDEVRVRTYTELDSKLTVSNPDPRLEYRWVNDDPHTVQQRYKQGYRPVTRADAATNEEVSKVPPWMRGAEARNDVPGNNTPMLQAGNRADGAGRRAILMARPIEFRDLQNANFRSMLGERNKALDPRAAAAEGNTLEASDRSSFRGSVTIAGTA